VKSILKNFRSSIIAIVIWPIALITFIISAGIYLFAALFISPKKLYLFNHQSLIDQFLVAGTVREYITAVGADYQFSWPIWGRVIKRLGAIPIIRTELTKAIHSLSLAEDEIRKGTSFLMSPEGTRTRTGKMGEFKKGPFHLSLNMGVTIIPIGLMGAYKEKKFSDWRIYPGKINVKVGDPVKSEYYQKMSVEELRDDIRDKISVLCEDNTIAVTNNQ
jgi:1-acyl-sn-glycerol-3-phosphate acyltransferase